MQNRKHKIGHLFFKYILGMPLEKTEFNDSRKLAAELARRNIITLYTDAGENLIETENVGRATWYGYTQTEPTPKELTTLLGGTL
jgi:hypothetical protein